VGGTTLAKWRDRGVDLLGYSAARFSRIYIVLVPALALGYLLDTLGLRYFDAYAHLGSLNIGSLDNVEPRLGVKQLVGNFLMLQGTATEVLGSNGPLWSLAYEWWYYCLSCSSRAAPCREASRATCLWRVAVPLLVLLNKYILLWGLLWLVVWGRISSDGACRRWSAPPLSSLHS
jgi:peptidoglycan/LPS O-acetylase OafA/YrhL